MNGQAPMRVLCDGQVEEPRLSHPEGVATGPDGWIWCGGELGQIYRIAPDGSSREVVASTGGFCLGMAFDAAGDLFVCDLKHAAVFHLTTATGALERFADGVPGHRFRVPNYPAFDAAGRLYVSDSWDMDSVGPGIVRLEPDGSGELWHSGPFRFANGLAFSPDGTRLYVAETFRNAVAARRSATRWRRDVPQRGGGDRGSARRVGRGEGGRRGAARRAAGRARRGR